MKNAAVICVLMVTWCAEVRAQISDFRHTSFSSADSVAALYPAHPLNDLKSLAHKLTVGLSTDHEKFRAIFKWVCNNIEVDYALLTLNRRKRATLLSPDELSRWNRKFSAVVFKTLLNEHKTICTGYAYLVRELAVHAGLRCQIINGFASTKPNPVSLVVNHSWNVIELNNKWYVCDATWASGVFNLETRRFVKKYKDEYFLTDPEVFAQTHRRIEPANAAAEASVER